LSELQSLELVALTDARLQGMGKLRGLQELRLMGDFSDEGLKAFGRLTSLTSLKLNRTSIPLERVEVVIGPSALKPKPKPELTGLGLRVFQANKGLNELGLIGDSVTDALMAELKGFGGLRKLGLFRSAVSDAGLQELQKLKDLEELRMSFDGRRRQGLSDLQKALPNLRIEDGLVVDTLFP
jgi:hypothetical protein